MKIASLVTPESYSLEWQMDSHERLAIQAILSQLRPSLAIEVGTYKGGSLQVLADFSQKVISIDIDPSVKLALEQHFENVDFYTGKSHELLAQIFENKELTQKISFILIDGDHTTKGVKTDILTILNYFIPKMTCVILMHDSFNPDCRRGILEAPWSKYPFVHELDLDFMPGKYYGSAHDTAAPRTMWGGFACALLQPYERKDDLVILESQKDLFQLVYRHSSHSDVLKNLSLSVKNFLKQYFKFKR